MKQNRLLIILGTVIIVLAIVAVVGKKKGWLGKGDATEVITEKAEHHLIIETVAASGKIYPEIEVKLSPDVSGEIVELAVEEGDSVQKGDLLMKIKPDIYQSMVEQAEATVNQAKANLANARARLAEAEAQFENVEQSYNRNKKLYDQGVISESEYEAALANYRSMQATKEAATQTVLGARYSVESAQAALKETRDNLSKTTIFAPMNGIVSSLLVEEGERVVGTTQMPGTEILRIANFEHMEVKVNVSESDIIRVNIGDTTYIDVDAYPDRENFVGLVTQIANSANITDQLTSDQVTNFTVDIRILEFSYQDLLEDESVEFPFRPGMSASVSIETAKVPNTLSVPIQAVTIRELTEKELEVYRDTMADKTLDIRGKTEEVVFRYVDGKAIKTKVKAGIQDDQYIQIISGLEEGDEVITGPYRAIARTLNDGDEVLKVTKEELYKEQAGPPVD